jgi:hypothetical protein
VSIKEILISEHCNGEVAEHHAMCSATYRIVTNKKIKLFFSEMKIENPQKLFHIGKKTNSRTKKMKKIVKGCKRGKVKAALWG